MNDVPAHEHVERIVVALDASPQSVSALVAAAELAGVMQAQLEALFVEDIGLLHLCELPFGHEVGSYSGALRRLESRGVERQLRVLAASIEQATERVAVQARVPWSFTVRRGVVVKELLAAGHSASLICLGRAGHVRIKGMGSTARSLVGQARQPVLIAGEGRGLAYPLQVVYTGTPAAERALRLALRLSGGEPKRLHVLVCPGGDVPDNADELEQAVRGLAEGEVGLGEGAALLVTRVDRPEGLPAALADSTVGTLVLPHDQTALVAETQGPALLVP